MANRFLISLGLMALAAMATDSLAGQVLTPPVNPPVQSSGPIVRTPGVSSSKTSSTTPPASADRLLWDRYISSVMDKLYKTWNPPTGSKGKQVAVRLTIARSGQLLNARVVKSSGLPALDEAAYRKVLASAPFQAFPVSAKLSTIEIQAVFDDKTLSARTGKY